MTVPNTVAAGLIDNVTKRGAGSVYLVLLQSDIDPASTTLATMTEDTTAGGGRKAVTWTDPSTVSPPVSQPTEGVAFGPYTADMQTAVTTVALVDAASGTTGTIRKTWDLGSQFQPKAGDFITIPAVDLTLGLQ